MPKVLLPAPAQATILCTLSYNLAGGGAFYKRSTGVVRCDKGQSLGNSVQPTIRDIIGAYGTAEINAGTSASAPKAQVVTKGAISLALSGTGSGRTLGISFGSFVISARRKSAGTDRGIRRV